MKATMVSWILISLFTSFIIGCKKNNAPTDLDIKTSLAARAWRGYNFLSITVGQTSRVVKDPVLLFDFKGDGTCVLSQASYSVSSISGQWKLENQGTNVVLTLQRPFGTDTEILPIHELSSTRFIFGDTTLYGYSLIPN